MQWLATAHTMDKSKIATCNCKPSSVCLYKACCASASYEAVKVHASDVFSALSLVLLHACSLCTAALEDPPNLKLNANILLYS
jgi:hypothetical protein